MREGGGGMELKYSEWKKNQLTDTELIDSYKNSNNINYEQKRVFKN